ncbi:hypothetical protein LX32DRAFT_683456 [Colletotrichum zoysiae]|uniref:Uncharacterized protein n=1 Tax=Colletotrichum zoysiae TaxID=1216348 RepID=A0AAD9HHB9_9PEZI|nr:hypothetical protein LX32DRAFT_683456 [Colletotrichum zoysiae]
MASSPLGILGSVAMGSPQGGLRRMNIGREEVWRPPGRMVNLGSLNYIVWVLEDKTRDRRDRGPEYIFRLTDGRRVLSFPRGMVRHGRGLPAVIILGIRLGVIGLPNISQHQPSPAQPSPYHPIRPVPFPEPSLHDYN